MVKPFISNKGNTDHNDIILIEEGKQIRDRKGVAEKLNNFSTDIIHITTGKTVIPLEDNLVLRADFVRFRLPKYFGRCYYKMPEVVADKVKHYFANLGKEKQIMKISLKEKRTPDEAFLSEKVAFEV